MAAQAGAEFYPIPIRQDDLADHFADAIAQAETLCFNAHGVAKYLLSRAVRDAGYKVVLTGEGSDEILGGYAHFRRDMLLYNREGQDPAAIRRLLAELEAANPVSRGLLLPDGSGRRWTVCAACSASSRPGSRPSRRAAARCSALLSPATSVARFASRGTFRASAQQYRRPRPARGARCR